MKDAERESQNPIPDGAEIAKAAASRAVEEMRTALNGNSRFKSFFSRLSGYFTACRDVHSFDDWMQLNKKRFGSEVLYADEAAGGLVVGYAAGIVLNNALRLGLLFVGAGYLAVQLLSYYGFLTVNWRKVDETVRNSLNAVDTTKLNDENSKEILLKFKLFMQRSLPSTIGFAAGLACGVLKG